MKLGTWVRVLSWIIFNHFWGACAQVFGDALLTSSLSTFGYLAGALFPKPTQPRGSSAHDAPLAAPALWVASYGTEKKAGPVQRADTQEPCMHFYRLSTGSCNLARKEPAVCLDTGGGFQSSGEGLLAVGLHARRNLREGGFEEQWQQPQQRRRQLKTEAHKLPPKLRRPRDPSAGQAAYAALHGANATAATAALPSSPSPRLHHTLLAANADRLVC